MDSEIHGCRQIFFKLKEIILVHILMKELINQEVNSFIRTGPEEEGIPLLQLIMFKEKLVLIIVLG
jgi:hypothetical protein